MRKVWTNSSLRKFNGHHHDVLAITEYLCHIWSRIFSVCRSQNPFNLSLFMTYFYVLSINHKTGATSIRTTWLNGSSPFSRAFMFAYSVLCVVFCGPLSCCSFSAGNCIVCSTINCFSLPVSIVKVLNRHPMRETNEVLTSTQDWTTTDRIK